MSKRKRDEEDSYQDAANSNTQREFSRKRKVVDGKIHHGKTVLHRSLKIAKGFERQKLGKRHKNAQQQGTQSEVSRIEDEIHALKNLDLKLAAESHLYKFLQKSKAILENDLLPDYVKTSSKPLLDPAVANVTARLYNSRLVKEALAEASTSVRRALGIQTREKRERGGHLEGEDPYDASIQGKTVDRQRRDNSAQDRLSGEYDSSDYKQKEGVAAVGSNESDNEFDEANSFVASQSDDNEDAESDSIKAEQDAGKRGSQLDVDVSLSPSPPTLPSLAPIAYGSNSHIDAYNVPHSAYLPSLTMGGYISGSDFDMEPVDDIEQVKPRRNRRGQRARQKIWEKKYGTRAKHLQNNKAPETANSRDSGWDLKRGARAEGYEGKGRREPRWRKEKRQGSANEGFSSADYKVSLASKATPPKGTDLKQLHPSWEAARKAKEQKPTRAFEGKKVTFD